MMTTLRFLPALAITAALGGACKKNEANKPATSEMLSVSVQSPPVDPAPFLRGCNGYIRAVGELPPPSNQGIWSQQVKGLINRYKTDLDTVPYVTSYLSGEAESRYESATQGLPVFPANFCQNTW